MKIIGADKSYIDYTGVQKRGVRVWAHQCQALVKTNEGWEVHEEPFPLPLDKRFLILPLEGGDAVTAIAMAARTINHDELLPLLRKELRFEDALI